MLMIRFQRIGRKNDPAFRMVVLPKSAGPKAGKYVDLVGSYNPRTKAMTVNGEAIKSWIAKGAQVSPSLKNLLITKGILEGKKQNVLPKKTRIVSEQPAEAAAPAAEAVAVVEETGEEVPVAEVVDASEEVAQVAAEDAAAEEVKEEAPAA
ncbi:MAG: 30S ribosomal protein S16 [Patescibacteria group bacterium]